MFLNEQQMRYLLTESLAGKKRTVAADFEINFMTLQRFCKRHKQRENDGSDLPAHVGYKRTREVLPDDMESELAEYLLDRSKLYFGLSTKEIRRLAFEFAIKNNIVVRTNWTANQMASVDWLTNFLKHHPRLFLRIPEATSLSQGTNFNQTNVAAFFNLLKEVVDRYKFEPQDMYNVDEMGIATVQKPDRIVARKGAKQVGFVTSAERGTLVIFCFAANANGNLIPPMFLFFTKKLQGIFCK
ncbi:uncharacterized protein LOC115887614 [Sitophilus oryzae]|uniref:Uncharacterized protein LOC115887614 n=1 Tax=Sitophilus oryzae TaxID=7048 RepID=A0A6J2YJ94_SITOR|nr:uncharacterized protein LOC115887614 [Sitophilus oryzae]